MVSKSSINSDSDGRSTQDGRQVSRWTAVEIGGGIVLLLLLIFFVGEALLPGRVLLPLDLVVKTWPPWQQPNQLADAHNPLITDVVDYIFPVKTFTADAVRRGEWPLWNPYVLGGYPATYNTQAALFYPLSVFYYLLPAVTAVDFTIITQLLLGGLFMFAFLRQLRLRRLAAWVGATLFLFNGMMVVWLEWQVVHAAVIWLPLQLYFIERLTQQVTAADKRAAYRSAVWGGVAFAIPWLGGHWNWALYGSMTAVLYGLWRLWTVRRKAWRPAALSALIGMTLPMIQVLPAFNYLRQGHRQPIPFADSLHLGLLNRFVTILLPDFFGNPVHYDWWGKTNYNETAVYLGVLPLTLALLGVVWWRQQQAASFFTSWGALGLLWALGTPVYGLLYVLPVFDGLWPSRAATVFLFCASVLAAMAVDRLLQPASRLPRKALWALLPWALLPLVYGWVYRPEWAQVQHDVVWWGAGGVATAVLFWLHGQKWLPRMVWALLLLGWVAIDLARAGGDYNTIGHVADLYPTNETIDYLRRDTDLFRIATLPQGVAFPPNSSLQSRLQNLSGYEPAILQRLVNFVEMAEGELPIYFEREL
ncbi:MAG: hypothetical protein KC415_15100, partial [Anaerolineales bacterium]|nr:hypothetical protein [Anaerolineales bacterium]